MSERRNRTTPNAQNLPSPAALLERAADFYHDELSESPGFDFLLKGNLADNELLQAFRIGWCGGRLLTTLPSPSENSPHKALAQAGILLPDGTERFLGCLTFPLLDPDGAVTGLCGIRVPHGQLVIPESLPLHLWNAPALAVHPEILLGGSPLDALALQAAGYPNACGLAGHPTDHDHRLLRELGVIRIILAGAEADGGFPGVECLRICLPGGKSPRDLLASSGVETLATAIDKAPRNTVGSGPGEVLSTASGFTAQFGGRRYEIMGIDKSSRRLKATVRSERGGRIHVDTVDFYSARSRRSLCQDLCRLHEEPPPVIEADVSRLMHACENRPDTDAAQPPAVMSRFEREEAESFGRDANLLQRILEDYETLGLVGERANKLLCYLAAVSRLMPEPLSVMILSSSGAGKSALQEATLRLCPPEDVVKVTSLSGKALFYKGKGSLKHKILALEENAGADDAAYAIRALISSGELIIETAVKDLGTGKLTTMQNRVEGPTAVFVTTTDPDTDPETRSRFFVTSVDESREQTRAILEFQRRKQTLQGRSESADTQAVLRRHRNFQRLLKPLAVVNPKARELGFSDDRLQSRRDQPKYLNLIASMAFLRQMGKKPKTTSSEAGKLRYVEVDEADLAAATELAGEIMGRSLGDLNAVSRDLLMQIEKMAAARAGTLAEKDVPAPGITEIEFTRRDIREYTGWPHTRVKRYLRQLVDFEYLAVVSGRFGQCYQYRLAAEGLAEGDGLFVPGLGACNLATPGHHLAGTWSAPGQSDSDRKNLPRNSLRTTWPESEERKSRKK